MGGGAWGRGGARHIQCAGWWCWVYAPVWGRNGLHCLSLDQWSKMWLRRESGGGGGWHQGCVSVSEWGATTPRVWGGWVGISVRGPLQMGCVPEAATVHRLHHHKNRCGRGNWGGSLGQGHTAPGGRRQRLKKSPPGLPVVPECHSTQPTVVLGVACGAGAEV